MANQKPPSWYRRFGPAKTITHDTEKTRFAWGVKSLPWLILADSKHIVRAEDFGIGELEEKVREN